MYGPNPFHGQEKGKAIFGREVDRTAFSGTAT